MERRLPSGSRPKIPGGYGNYLATDPDSPTSSQDTSQSQRRRAPGPWGGHFQGQEQVALPTKPWEAGAPLYPEHLPEQQQYEGQQDQSPPLQRWDPSPGAGASGPDAAHPPSGYGTYPQDPRQPQPQPRGYLETARSRRKQSPLLADAPRLTVLPPAPRGDRASPLTPSEAGVEEDAAGAVSPAASPVRERPRSIGRDDVLGAAAGREGRRGVGYRDLKGGSFRGVGRNVLDGTSNDAGGGYPRSPFLTTASGGPTTWRSPLEQSAVNPFSASFGNVESYPSPGGRLQARGRVLGGKEKAAEGGREGASTQRLVGRGSGGYGSQWEGGGSLGLGADSKASSKRPRSSGHTVDDQGNQIFYKHGVRLVEATEIQLEALGRPATYAVFILPYLLLALALWLDRGQLDVMLHSFPCMETASNNPGVCDWTIDEFPAYNSFLTLRGDFVLVDGIFAAVSSKNVTDHDEQSPPPTPNPRATGTGSADLGDGRGSDRRRRTLNVSAAGDSSYVGWVNDGSSFASLGGDSGAAVTGVFAEVAETAAGEVWWKRSARGWADRGEDAASWNRSMSMRNLISFGEISHEKDDSSNKVHLHVGVALEVRGNTGTGKEKDWDLLYSCTANDNVKVVTCYFSDGSCNSATLGHVAFNGPGLLKVYSQYSVEATIVLIQDGKQSSKGGGLLAQSASFDLMTESQTYVKALASTRLPLLALTALLLLYWTTRGLGSAGGKRDPAPAAIVPERRYITVLLLGLLMWQNPILAVEEWTPGGFGDGVYGWARLARDLCQFVGMQLVWLCWICIMDGQHFVRRRRRTDPQASSSITNSSADAAHRRAAGDDQGASIPLFAHDSPPTPPPGFLKDEFPPHHPKSESFIDFLLPKLLYGATSLVVGVALTLVRHPAVATLDKVGWLSGTKIEIVFAVLSMMSGLLLLGWAVFFARVTVSSGRMLRGQPFMSTRRQQLTYRVMVMQAFLVALLLGLAMGINLVSLGLHLFRQLTVSGARDFSLEAFVHAAAGLSTWTGGVREPLGKLLLISAVCFNLAFLFLPPSHSVKRLFDRMYINMERDMPPREVVRRYKDSKELSPLFCVETSCYLVEVAWQVYYDPQKANLDNMVASDRQDLSYLGLELVAYFSDEELETRAMLCKGKDRFVLAFRGTAKMENLMTDLKIHQVPLPQLLSSGRAPIEINLADAHSQSSSRYSASGFSNTSGRGGSAEADADNRGKLYRAYSTPEATMTAAASAAGGAEMGGAGRRSSYPFRPSSISAPRSPTSSRPPLLTPVVESLNSSFSAAAGEDAEVHGQDQGGVGRGGDEVYFPPHADGGKDGGEGGSGRDERRVRDSSSAAADEKRTTPRSGGIGDIDPAAAVAVSGAGVGKAGSERSDKSNRSNRKHYEGDYEGDIRSSYEMSADRKSNVYEDFEAGGGVFGEEDFDIDSRGGNPLMRCCKACIHRIPVARQALPRVHGGFWEAYSKMREKVLAALASELQADYRPLYVTGHSLGGALASLAAYDIEKNFSMPDPITLYTFGSPQVGNAVFCHKLNSRVKHHFRVVNDGDVVTGLPRFFGTYKQAGCVVVVDSDRYGHFIVAPTMVEKTFGAKPLRSVTPHQLNEYRECLEACMEEADLEDYFSRGIGVEPDRVPGWLKEKRRRDKEED